MYRTDPPGVLMNFCSLTPPYPRCEHVLMIQTDTSSKFAVGFLGGAPGKFGQISRAKYKNCGGIRVN